MSEVRALKPASETKWTVISGAMAGTVRLMTAESFTIGRAPDNEFVIVNDPKCSRKHAAVQWNLDGCHIASLNGANPVLVNGKEMQTARLADGDIVTLGETEVQFNETTGPGGDPLDRPTHFAIVPTGTPAHQSPAMRPYPPSAYAPVRPHGSAPPSRKKQANSTRIVIYTVLGLFVVFLFIPTGGKKKDALSLRTEQQIQADIDAANKLNEAAQNMPVRRFDESVTVRQAQENYVRGFRDYRKGQFERSLESFQACLALDPAHILCNRYLRLAQRRFNELVQYDIVLGRKYRDQNQFQACRSAFRNVMVMVKDANNPAYREAKANYDACNNLAEGRF